MKELTLTIAQFLFLRKVQERISFDSDVINDYLIENNEKENLPTLVLKEDDVIDLVESLAVFDGDEDEMDMAEKITKQLYPEEVEEE